jgi:hypothetical protein
MVFDPDEPYNNLALVPRNAEPETKAVLRKAIAANKAPAELKGSGELIPNRGVAINASALQEAKLWFRNGACQTRGDNRSRGRYMFAKRTHCADV